MNTASFILACLNLATALTKWVSQRQALDAGQDKEIARAALAVLELTKRGKEIRAAVAAMSDQDADGLWDRMVSS
jgi:hypothetical protein